MSGSTIGSVNSLMVNIGKYVASAVSILYQ